MTGMALQTSNENAIYIGIFKPRTLVNLGIVGYKRDQIKLIRILFLSRGDI